MAVVIFHDIKIDDFTVQKQVILGVRFEHPENGVSKMVHFGFQIGIKNTHF